MEFFPTDDVAAHVDRRIRRMRFAADELEALLHRHDALDLWPAHECFQRLMRSLVTDRADDCTLDATHDVRAIPELANFAQDAQFLLLRDFRLEDNDHKKQKAAGDKPAAKLKSKQLQSQAAGLVK